MTAIFVEPALGDNFSTACELFHAYRLFYGKAQSTLEQTAVYLRERLEAGEAAAFVAKREGHGIGYLLLYPAFSSVNCCKGMILNDLFVSASERGSGVGTKLIEFALRFAEANGASFVNISTAKTNLGAKRLYERLGFVTDEAFQHFTRHMR